MVEIRVCVCVLIRRFRMSTQIGGLGQLVFEQNDIGGQWIAGAQPDPCLGDVRIGVEPAVNQVAVVVDDGVFFAEQVVLDLLHIVAGEMRAVDA